MGLQHLKPIWRWLGQVLWPWPALVLGVAALSFARWWQAQATWQDLVLILGGDALLVVRSVGWWCLLLLPLLALPVRWRWAVQGVLGSVYLLLLASLDVYFVVAGVPLGADLLAYSWDELSVTVSAAQVKVPAVFSVALGLGWLALWLSLWWMAARVQPVFSDRTTALVLGACLSGGWVLPAAVPGAAGLTSNKLMFLVADVLASQAQNGAGFQATGPYPFERTETTPDTLGPLLSLDAKTPPNLVLLVVEGLGRSFSGPGARLGSFTPFLDELASRSLYWENFLATQGRTFAVLPSVLGSLPYGPYGEQNIHNDNLLSLLKGQGYSLRYFSGSNLAFDHQGAFLSHSGVQTFWSERDFGAPERKLTEWGYPDGDLLQTVADKPLPTSPSVTVVQTMSMHTPFVVPQATKYRQQVEARLQALGVEEGLRASYRQQANIYASILYTDEAIKTFFASIANRPEWRNTVFLITGDHRLPEISMVTRLERYHVPLIVYSPMLRAPQRIKALSSHFDIAPALLAMLSQRYAMPTPQRVHWLGAGLDVHPQWRNVHALPLKQTKTELSDYVSGEFYLAQDQLFSLQDGLVASPEESPAMRQALQAELAQFKANLAPVMHQARLVAERQDSLPYAAAGRSLEAAGRVRQIEGVVVADTQGAFAPDGTLQAQAVFGQHGSNDSVVFVPLLVLTDPGGRELGEVSGPALSLKAGQHQQVSLSLKPNELPSGTYYMSMVVSHPETGRPVGKGQYHVQVRR
jgi:hypothetical protein